MSLLKFVDDCDASPADGGGVVVDDYSPRLPQPRNRRHQPRLRGFLDAETAGQLRAAAASGAALQAVAPITPAPGAEPAGLEQGTSAGGLVVLGLAAWFLFR